MSSKKPASRIRSLAGISKVSSSQQLVKAKKRAMSLPLRKRVSRSSAEYDDQKFHQAVFSSQRNSDGCWSPDEGLSKHFACEKCGVTAKKPLYCIAQQASGHDVTYKCTECSHKMVVPR